MKNKNNNKDMVSERERDSGRDRENDNSNKIIDMFNASKNEKYKDFNNIDIEAAEKFIHTIKEKRNQSLHIEDIDDISISSL